MSYPPNPISTPPSTTLSTPSPTELHDSDPLATATMSPARTLKNIYIVVATTPITTPTGVRFGIGLNGRLPWPMIKADMNYFRRVTTDGREASSSSASSDGDDGSAKQVNSVIMGRKTYESIPPSYRPLSGRRNYIVTRGNAADLAERFRKDLMGQSEKATQAVKERYTDGKNQPDASTLPKTSTEYRELQLSEAEFTTTNNSNEEARVTSSNDAINPLTITSSLTKAITDTTGPNHGGIFCIGGAEIYKLLLQDSSLRPRLRVLQTEIQKMGEGEEFECDTFWPEELKEGVNGWREIERGEAVEWTGIEVPQGGDGWLVNAKVGVRIRVRGWKQVE